MEATFPLIAAALAGAGCLAGLSGEGQEGLWRAREAYRALRAPRRALSSLASSTLVGALLERPAWREASEAVAERARAAGAGPPDEGSACAALVLAGPATAVLLGWALASPAWALAGLLAPSLGVRAYAERARAARERRLSAAMPEVFRSLSTAMSAGMTLVQSAEYAGSHIEGEAGEAFARLALRMRCGESAEDALEALVAELPAPGVGMLASALTVSHRTGSPLGALFQRSARLVEQQGEFERLLAVKTAQVRLSVRIVCALPAAMVALLAAISPDFQAGLASPAGLACLFVASLLDCAAVMIIRRIVAGALP